MRYIVNKVMLKMLYCKNESLASGKNTVRVTERRDGGRLKCEGVSSDRSNACQKVFTQYDIIVGTLYMG